MPDNNYSSEDMKRYFNDPEYRRSHMQRTRKLLDRRHLLLYASTFAAVVLLTWYIIYIISGLPALEKYENPKLELATKIYASDGVVLDQFNYKNRTRITLDKLPPGLVKALVSTEDKDFYNHWGVNLPRFVRQMIINVVTFRQAGASTITQQLARNLYKLQVRHESIFDKMTRKIREFFSSVQIERKFTKNEILELYLNVAYFGRQAYGIESAAQAYFGKTVTELSVPEYTLLVGMLKGPGYYDPILHTDRALGRRDYVIDQMVKEGVLTPQTAAEVRKDSLNFRLAETEFRSGIAPHFVESVRQQLIRKAEKYGFDIYEDGLQVFTTLDSRMQRHAIAAIEEHLKDYQTSFDANWDWAGAPDILTENIQKAVRENDYYRHARNAQMRDSIMNALHADKTFIDSVKKAAQTIEVGFVCIDPHTGHILAEVGGRNYRTFKYGLNHVTQIRRQPGSAFKPFVYTVAIDNGYPPCYELQNQPVTIPMPDGSRWTPENFDKSVGGKFTLREAIKQSLNLVTVRMITDAQIAPARQVAEYARRMGILSPIPAYESIALGTAVVSPLEITSAFGVFPNEGVLVSPVAILRIEDKDGNIIENNAPEKKEVLSKETAYIMTDMLEGVVGGGTATRAIRSFYRGPAAGKTGTTNDYADAWFVGFTPQLSTGVWVGFDDVQIRFSSNDGQGGRAAAPIVGRFWGKVYEDPSLGLALEYFNQPEGVVTDTICADTKKKAREFCPVKVSEIFNVKYPLALCDKHTSANAVEGTEEDIRKRSKTNW